MTNIHTVCEYSNKTSNAKSSLLLESLQLKEKCNSGSSVITFSELLHNTDTDLFTYVGGSGGVTARNHSLTEVQVETKYF